MTGSVEKNLPYLVNAHSNVIKTRKPASVLEIASGFGDHILAYAREHPSVHFQPTEYDNYLVSELTKKIDDAGLPNVSRPIKLNVLDSGYPSRHLRKETSRTD